jgi:DNA-binding transcriptional regulator YiaG
MERCVDAYPLTHLVRYVSMNVTPTQKGAAAMNVESLLERVRSGRRMPPAAERRRLREAHGLSLRDVAGAVGVSHTAVSRWEKGAQPREHRSEYLALLEGLSEL